tara:strand:- start:857 stop:1096 length:240 start_codon:yes stop_codon:yes gene_type:complete
MKMYSYDSRKDDNPVNDPLANLRTSRDYVLSATDWTQSSDSPLSDEKKAEWAVFRQKLRDLPTTYNEATGEYDWPVAPN